MSKQCVFCDIVAGDSPSVTVAEDDTSLAFMDINPASDGHLLVIPKRHSTDLHVIPRYVDKARDRLTLPWTPTRGRMDTITELGARLSAAAN